MAETNHTQRIVTILVVWMVSFVCSQILLSVCLSLLSPYSLNLVIFGHDTGIDRWTFFLQLVINLPSIALVGVLIAEMAKRRTFDIADLFALVVTLFIGLPGALLYTLVPQRHVLYGGLLSINPFLHMLKVYHALPPVVFPCLTRYNTIVVLMVNIIIMVVLALETRRNAPSVAKHLPMLVVIGLYFPACSVLLRFALDTPEADVRYMRRYTTLFIVLSLLFMLDNIVLTLFSPRLDYNYSFNNIHATALTVINACYCIYVFVAMLCDQRVRAVRQYGWLAVGGLIAPDLLFSVARLCLTRNTVVEENMEHCTDY